MLIDSLLKTTREHKEHGAARARYDGDVSVDRKRLVGPSLKVIGRSDDERSTYYESSSFGLFVSGSE